MAYKQPEFRTVPEGGTDTGSFTSDTVICAGTTSTNSFQNVADTGITYEVLTSQGAGSLPAWAELSNATFFELLATDPSSPTIGQTWYNTTSNEFKGFLGGGGSGVWIVKASISAARSTCRMVGTGGDAFLFGTNSNAPTVITTERYNGTLNTWTTKANLDVIRQTPSGVGSSDDALCVGGLSTPSGVALTSVVRYNSGTNTWSSAAAYPLQFLSGMSGANGDATDAFIWGGQNNSGTTYKSSYKYDGVGDTWTSKADVSVTIGWNNGAGGGEFTSALSFGGRFDGIKTDHAEAYDGSANVWTTKADMNNVYTVNQGGGTSSNACLAFGGITDPGVTWSDTTEEYDGTSNTWSIKASMNTAVSDAGGCGTTLDALRAGGLLTGVRLSSSERYNASLGTVVIFDLS